MYAMGAAWDDVTSNPARVLSKTGVTAPVDCSSDHHLSQESRAIIEDSRASSWSGEKWNFLQMRA